MSDPGEYQYNKNTRGTCSLMDELYRLVGIVMRNAQAIEKNLSSIIYYDKILGIFGEDGTVSNEEYDDNHDSADELFEAMSWMTMGNILTLARRASSLSEEMVDRLSRVLKNRNYVAHRMFKNKAFNVGASLSQNKLYSMKNRLIEEVNFSAELNNDLVNIAIKLEETYEAVEQS
jgi:hypothetical protein